MFEGGSWSFELSKTDWDVSCKLSNSKRAKIRFRTFYLRTAPVFTWASAVAPCSPAVPPWWCGDGGRRVGRGRPPPSRPPRPLLFDPSRPRRRWSGDAANTAGRGSPKGGRSPSCLGGNTWINWKKEYYIYMVLEKDWRFLKLNKQEKKVIVLKVRIVEYKYFRGSVFFGRFFNSKLGPSYCWLYI